MTALLFLGAQGLVLCLFAAAALLIGRLALGALFDRGERQIRDGETGLLRNGFALTCGLFLLATFGWALGAVGRLDRAHLLFVAVGIVTAGIGWRKRIGGRSLSRSEPRAPRFAALRSLRVSGSPAGRPAHLPGVALAASALTALALAGLELVLAIYPPIAFDETLYHLPFVRAVATSGGLPFLAELRFPVFPQLSEVLSAELMIFGGDTATHFVALLAVLVTAVLLWCWGTEWGGEAVPGLGWMAAALWLGNPLVTYLSGTGYVEPTLALFATAAAYAHWIWRRSGIAGWLMVSAVCAGAAAGTKYLGLFVVAALAVATLLPRLRANSSTKRSANAAGSSSAKPAAREGGRSLGVDLALFAVIATIALAPWYGRLVVQTGNPLFPYLSAIFGRNDWTPVHFRGGGGAKSMNDWIAGTMQAVQRLITLPWDVVARRQRVGGLPPLSPAYLVGIPLLLLGMRRDRALRGLLAAIVAYLAFFLALPADARYLVPVLPVLGLGIAVAASSLFGGDRFRRRRSLTVAVALLLAMPGWLYGIYRVALLGPPPLSPSAREEFLHSALTYYPAVAAVNRLVLPGQAVYGLHLEESRYYVHGTFLGDWYGPHRFSLVLDRLQDPAALLATLRSWQVAYLMVNRSTPAAALLEGAGPSFAPVFENRAVRVYALRTESGGG
ncbi:MAG: hypothetical protein ABI639_04350 [Thermoanaerobaculia bacterium]